MEFDVGWARIETEAIRPLLGLLSQWGKRRLEGKLFENEQYISIYTVAYKLCTQRTPYNFADRLYVKHTETIRTYLEQSAVAELRGKRGTVLLESFVQRWEVFRILNKWMGKFLMYLDRFHVSHHNLPTLHESGLNAFVDVVFDVVSADVTRAILDQVQAERNGESVDTDLLKRCIDVYKACRPDLERYERAFEAAFLDQSRLHFRAKAHDWIQTDSTPQYLVKVEGLLRGEVARVAAYLVASSESKVEQTLVGEMLRDQETALLEKEGSGVRALLRDDKKEDLARVHRMFSRIPKGLDPIAEMVKQHIQAEGNAVIEKRKQALAESADGKESPLDQPFIQALLDLHERYRLLVQEQFAGEALFQKALKGAFEVTVNMDVGKHSNAELLAAFADSVLKSGGEERLSDAQIEDVLNKVCQLFAFLSEKDVFAEVYRNNLAKRLLNQRSASEDAERSMIARLKLRCGAQFTSKIEGMLTDLMLGKDLAKRFAAHVDGLAPAERPPCEFTVEVLTTGHWPSYKQVGLALPTAFHRCTRVFEAFYDKVTDHRKLAWLHTQGTASLKATFKPGSSYEIQLTTLQALALVMFNDADYAAGGDPFLSFEQLNERLGKEPEVTKRVLHSLSCQPKFKILDKVPENAKSVAATDRFRVNVDFSSKTRKFRVQMASLEDTHNPQRVEEDRGLAVEAAIVRIMKARKRLNFATLQSEVMSQLVHFKPQPKVVKKKIELLLEREYLARDESDPNFYKYLA